MFSFTATGSISLLAVAAFIGIAASFALSNVSAQPARSSDDFVANDPNALVVVDDAGNPWVEIVVVEAE